MWVNCIYHFINFTHFYCLFSYIFARYSFDPQIANANRGGSFIYFLFTDLIKLHWKWNGNEELYHKRTKRYTRKEKRKITYVYCKGEKNPGVSRCTKNIVELVQFDSVLLCLNFSIFSRYVFLGNSLSIQWVIFFFILTCRYTVKRSKGSIGLSVVMDPMANK